jgi:hypothetical protein
MKPSYPEAVSDAARKGSILGLFTQVRGIRILGSSYPRSCITTPQYPMKSPLQTFRIALPTIACNTDG